MSRAYVYYFLWPSILTFTHTDRSFRWISKNSLNIENIDFSCSQIPMKFWACVVANGHGKCEMCIVVWFVGCGKVSLEKSIKLHSTFFPLKQKKRVELLVWIFLPLNLFSLRYQKNNSRISHRKSKSTAAAKSLNPKKPWSEERKQTICVIIYRI